VLNLHSMCAAQGANRRKTPLLITFVNSCIHLPTCLGFLFLPSFRYLFSVPLWNLSLCFIIFVISVCISTSINSISRRIAPLHSISRTWSRWNYFCAKLSVAVLKYVLLHILSGVHFGLQHFSLSWHFYWVATRICVLCSLLAPSYG